MKFPKKTTADVPPSVAAEYRKAPRGQAVSEATGDGYTDTAKMKKGKMAPKGQFGLPPSPGKGPGLHLRISVRPDTDKDMM